MNISKAASSSIGFILENKPSKQVALLNKDIRARNELLLLCTDQQVYLYIKNKSRKVGTTALRHKCEFLVND